MNPSVNDMCNWIGTIDAKANGMIDGAIASGAMPELQGHALTACITQSLLFVAQLLRALDDMKPRDQSETPEAKPYRKHAHWKRPNPPRFEFDEPSN